MKVSLRKANALQAAINEQVNSLDLATEIAINEFEKPGQKLSEAKSKFDVASATRKKLLGANYEIRKQVAVANADSGINDLLADLAMIEKDIGFYSKLVKMQPALDNDVIVGKLGKIKGKTEDIYGRYGDDVVKTTIFTASELEAFKEALAGLKKLKVSLQDNLLELNVSTEITVSEETEKLLAKAGII